MTIVNCTDRVATHNGQTYNKTTFNARVVEGKVIDLPAPRAKEDIMAFIVPQEVAVLLPHRKDLIVI